MQFDDFARDYGLIIHDLQVDGHVHRVPTESHPRKRNGAYLCDGESGYVQDWAIHANPIAWRADRTSAPAVRRPARDIEAERRAEQERRDNAARYAAEVVAGCSFEEHPYLVRKGFPAARGLVDTDGRLVVPMRAANDYRRINSIQWIDAAGGKKFLTGGAAKGSIFVIGSARESWLCEGYATGLSIRAALDELRRPARVVVCFSAGNLTHVASLLGGRRLVVADNDESGTGERSARATALPWTMPPNVGSDANDMHQQAGLRPLVDLMRDLIVGSAAM